jgi:hypothetical protein
MTGAEPTSAPQAVAATAPAPVSPELRAALDAEHLRILAIAYYIAGGATALFSCFFLIHFAFMLAMGMGMLVGGIPTPHHGGSDAQPPPALMFFIFAAVIAVVILLGWTFGAAQIYVGRCLRDRRHFIFVLVIAGLECAFVPWGTALGVFTFVVLTRPTVKALFPAG